MICQWKGIFNAISCKFWVVKRKKKEKFTFACSKNFVESSCYCDYTSSELDLKGMKNQKEGFVVWGVRERKLKRSRIFRGICASSSVLLFWSDMATAWTIKEMQGSYYRSNSMTYLSKKPKRLET